MNNPYFENILIPTDFSVTAANATKHGLALANKIQATVCFLHAYHFPVIVDPNGQMMYSGDFVQDYVTESEEKLVALQKESVILNPDLKIKYLNQEGFLADEVQAVCETKSIDLVVIGTKGASGIEEHVLGTNAALILESVKCPVLIIPEGASFKPYKRILFATNFQFDDIDALIKIIALADLFDAQIEVIHISDDPRKEERELDMLKEIGNQRADDKKIIYSTIPVNNSTLETLNNYIDRKGIDLVVMNATGKSFLNKLFNGSLTEKMAYHTYVPFLAFHVKQR